MNTIRKMKKNAKALSPVVASIILIAVTVAVSIAVAAWMGALVVGQMETEQLKITNCNFGTGSLALSVSNPGTSSVTIDQVYVDNTAVSFNVLDDESAAVPDRTVPANAQGFAVNATVTGITPGNNYAMKIVSTKGNYYTYTAIAP
jgi:flagellin-like protein